MTAIICKLPAKNALGSNHKGTDRVGSNHCNTETLANTQSHCNTAMAVTTTSWEGILSLHDGWFFGKTTITKTVYDKTSNITC